MFYILFTVPTFMTYGSLYSASISLDDYSYYQTSSWTSSGATFSISVSSGTVVLYASDLNQSPSSASYVWTVQTSGYTEIFLNPLTLGRAPGSTVYVTLKGLATTTNSYIFQVNSGSTLSTGESLHS